ncbi:MAG TPA: aminoacyl-tRNA hydrolase [Desulfobacterales bacterium]|nr:aminoacyl-tRNA hydrolase [Desulfobacterales bacterium]HJO62090.1 aminoacyl-tRNA hydrolase [Desulfobacterales bacterium]|tara:strand:- start:190 stop:783 length:594 start_codon:yes stop_codon:yes gene_type:complete
MSPSQLRLIVGLGNPGHTYKKTRHNIGFMVADDLAAAFSIPVEKKKFGVLYGKGLINDNGVILSKPQEFMNRCGPPIKKLAKYHNIFSEDLLVIHDDIDLSFGIIKIKEQGGSGGHKGLSSLIDAFGRNDFTRLRVGVGRPGAEMTVTDHVLSRFDFSEKNNLEQIIRTTRDAVVTILCEGIKEGMNRHNNRKVISS